MRSTQGILGFPFSIGLQIGCVQNIGWGRVCALLLAGHQDRLRGSQAGVEFGLTGTFQNRVEGRTMVRADGRFRKQGKMVFDVAEAVARKPI